MNNNQTLVVMFDSFEPWKKFILTDLKKYEEKTFDSGVKLNE